MFKRPRSFVSTLKSMRTDLLGLRDGGAMFHLRGRQRPAQVERDVATGAPGCNRIAEDHAGDGAEPTRAFVSSAQFEFSQGMQQLRRGHLADRTVAEGG